jgi:hypothetical protein
MYAGPEDGEFAGDTITGLQRFLSNSGYEPGPADGSWGEVTAKAFQTLLKDKAFYDGAIDGFFLEGTTGESITACQKWLASVGQDPGPADGQWGKVTIQALQKFLKTCWNPDAMCDGVRAEERMQWLVDNKGMSADDAKSKVKSEFPAIFGVFGSTDLIDCKFPHTMSVVDGKLKIAVTPKNPSEVSMVAVHYHIGDGKSMNFDINSPEAGTDTYVHVTPDWGENCPPGTKVSYWLCANVKGLLETEPHGACGHPDRRLYWTAR